MHHPINSNKNVIYSNSFQLVFCYALWIGKLLIWKWLLLLLFIDSPIVAVVKAVLTTRDTSIHVTHTLQQQQLLQLVLRYELIFNSFTILVVLISFTNKVPNYRNFDKLNNLRGQNQKNVVVSLPFSVFSNGTYF